MFWQPRVRLVTGLTNLTWITASFGWITIVAPILVAAPIYFSGKISFGGLMMAAAAFTQAQSSLRWFVDNFMSSLMARHVATRRELPLCPDPYRGATRVRQSHQLCRRRARYDYN